MENILSINNDVISVGEGTVESPYLISNTAQLDWFRDQVNGGASSIHGVLTADITYNVGMDVAGYGDTLRGLAEFTPIASGSTGYAGTFDGRGHVISGLYANWDDSPWCGLFGQVARDGVVKDVILRNSCFRTRYRDENGSVHLGGIAGRNAGTVSGCDVRATIVAASDLSGIECSVISCGGIVGSNAGSGTVSGCKSSGSVDANGIAMGNIGCGGIAGHACGRVRDCESSGSVLVSGMASSYIHCGGIAGYVRGFVMNCVSSGSVLVSGAATSVSCGGVAGYCDNTVTDCTSTCDVDVSGTAMGNISCGGIVGYDTGLVGDCVSRGSALVSGRALSHRYCGGVVGVCEGTGMVEDCVFSGSVYVSGVARSRVHCGVIVGVNNSGTVTGCAFLENGDMGQ